jgi:hypothetical protein
LGKIVVIAVELVLPGDWFQRDRNSHGLEESIMADPQPTPPGTVSLLLSLAGPVTSASIGVLMRHAHRAATGKLFSLGRLCFELPSVIGLGIMGGALGSWIGATDEVRWGIAALLGYLGTQGVDAIVARYVRSKLGAE